MEKKLSIEGKVLSVAGYKPKEGKEQELMSLVEKHLPALRSLGLATDRQNYIAKSDDGTVIEVFEWTSANAITAAHQHPAISDIWERMTMVADFPPLKRLAEANEPFCSFEILK